MRRLSLAFVLTATLSSPLSASQFAVGYQMENWSRIHVDQSTNSKYPARREPGFAQLTFNLPNITTWYLEEPGLIFGAISGMMDTEANRVQAKNQAIKDGNLTYRWAYGTPAPIPTGRWNRWSYSSGQATGAMVQVSSTPSPLPGGVLAYYDPKVMVEFQKLNMDIVTGPKLIGDSGLYWMPSADIIMMSMKIYNYSDGSNYTDAKRTPGTDFSTFTVPMNLHLGWKPKFFPYLTLEGKAGWDFISWGLFAIAASDSKEGLQNYSHGYNYSGKAALGVSWFEVYYQMGFRQEPLWNFSGYARRYQIDQSVIGARLDLGNLIGKLFF